MTKGTNNQSLAEFLELHISPPQGLAMAALAALAYHVVQIHLLHRELHQVPDVLPEEPEAFHLHLEAQLIASAGTHL